MQWLIKWAANLVTNYQIGTDWKTAIERIRGWKIKTPIAKFGERVLFKELADWKSHKSKLGF